MKILAIEQELSETTEDDFQAHLTQEAQRVWELYQMGVIRELYFRGDRNEAILILECESKDEAERVLQTLPLVKAELIKFDVIPLVPYPAFARLFGQGPSPASNE